MTKQEFYEDSTPCRWCGVPITKQQELEHDGHCSKECKEEHEEFLDMAARFREFYGVVE